MSNLQHTASIFKLFFIFCFLIGSSSAAIDDVSVNCGSSGASAAGSGKEWRGDIQPNSPPSLQMKGATVIRHSISGSGVPYTTARLSRSQFTYTLKTAPGQKILRLHFNPTSSRGFKRFNDLFDVEAGGFSLLGNFSASLAADALGLTYVVKEFCINIDEGQVFDIVFSPISSQLVDTYAFINGIEIISVPASLSYFHGRYVGVEMAGKSNVDNSSAIEVVRRVNLKQDSVSSDSDMDSMLGMWETISRRKESKIKSVKWRTSVGVGFRYLVRLHFSEIGLKMAEMSGVTFKLCINDVVVDTNIGISREGDYEDIVHWYRDYMVMIKGQKREGKRDVIISLQSNDKFMDGHGLLEGFEIMKLSNSDNSLASPNPFPSTPNSSNWIIQGLGQVLGERNMIATVVIAFLSLVNIIIHISCRIWEGRCREEKHMPLVKAGQRLCRRFSLAEIQLATRNFSGAHVIGRGGFGKVYRGFIDNGQVTVAVKRLRSDSSQGQREFLTEIETLTELRHVNLVSLIGYCYEREEMILVYEYMARGTLSDHLYKLSRKGNDCTSLTWKECLTICIGAGQGLDYLHTGHSLVHRDVKASNILLDENFVAKVADFGLARHVNRNTLQSHISTKVKGTFGYLDPIYYTTGKLTRKSDTYSFGVVLLEVLSGRPAVDREVGEDEWLLTKWVRESISKGKSEQIVAPNLRGEISEDSLKVFLEVAEKCLHDESKERPTMAEVVLQLKFALKLQDSSMPLALNVDDVHSSKSEANSPVNAQQLTMAPRDVQDVTPPPKEQTSNTGVVIVEPQSDREGWTKAMRPARLRPWEAFWNRVKPSGEYESLLLGIKL